MPLCRSLWTALLDLAAARECGGCGVEEPGGGSLCAPCGDVLEQGRARRALTHVAGAPRTYAMARYEEPVRGMLIAYKERGRCDLARPLAWTLARAVAALVDAAASGWGSDIRRGGGARLPSWPTSLFLIPMPSARPSVRERGDDTMARLARTAAKLLRTETGLATRALPALRHTRTVADQAGLDHADRAVNLAHAMRVRGRAAAAIGAAAAPIVLVDDIVTSGATLAEAARTLSATGFPVLGAATVAAARLPG